MAHLKLALGDLIAHNHKTKLHFILAVAPPWGFVYG